MSDRPAVVLLVEDEPAHAEIVRRHFAERHPASRLFHVGDGQAALDYVYRQEGYRQPERSPRPDLMLLDLRLPRVDGLEVLKTVKADPRLRSIPVVVLSTSAAAADLANAYRHHANSYLVKPVDFAQFTALLDALGNYWLNFNTAPRGA
ncbi:MAG: response regulator [Candidatus Competibacter sp.]|nr:response regulator [Candidatus Competibacter sp.]